MQSSYKVIKKSSVVTEGAKEIVTEFANRDDVYQKELGETNARIFIDSYENLAKTMIENAKKQRDTIISDAYSEADTIEKEAYDKANEKGYNDGFKQGYDDGVNKAFEEGYQNNVNKALAEADIIKDNADNILKICIEEKEKYVREKEDELRSLIMNCAESILKREVRDKDSMNALIFEALSQVRNTKTLIIKSKKLYCDAFKDQVDIWKEQIPLKGDVFIVPDESIEEGKAIIERDNGKVIVGVDIAMEKLRDIFNNVE